MLQNAMSDQGLHCLITECSNRILIKMKNTAYQPLKWKWTGLIDNNGKFIIILQVNALVHLLSHVTSVKAFNKCSDLVVTTAKSIVSFYMSKIIPNM